MTLRIGLTGPIGCGKSTVAGWLAELGAHAIDADDVARDVTAPGEPALDAVIARFGDALPAARRRPRSGRARGARVQRPGGARRPRGDHPPARPRADPGRALRRTRTRAWR